MKTNATIQELNEALKEVNKRFGNNITFKTLGKLTSKRNTFTLTVIDSHKPGHRRGFHNNRLVHAACWHVHGYFFEALLNINSDIYILSGNKLRIDKNGGNWIDQNIGSIMKPLYYSEACDCY